MKISEKGVKPPDVGCPGIRETAGDLSGAGLRIGVVSARYNERLTTELARRCVNELIALGVAADRIELVWVPGSYEVPFVADQWARTGRFDALIGLGCVIQGETPHAGLINSEVAHALGEIARLRQVPVIDTVVSAHTPAQAEVRCFGPESRGRYAARAAVEMARLRRALAEQTP